MELTTYISSKIPEKLRGNILHVIIGNFVPSSPSQKENHSHILSGLLENRPTPIRRGESSRDIGMLKTSVLCTTLYSAIFHNMLDLLNGRDCH